MRRIRTLSASAASLLSVVFASPHSQAQTAPGWSSAYALGTGIVQNIGASAVDATGNTYVLGSFISPLTLGSTTLTSQGSYDGFLAKYSPAGTLAWVRQLGSAGADVPRDVALDAGGNIYITGNFNGTMSLGNGVTLTGAAAPTASSTAQFFVARYSPQGLADWAQQTLPGNSTPVVGGGIGTDATGTVYVAGFCNGGVTIGSATATLPSNTPGTFLARFAGASGTLQSLTPGFYYSSNGTSITYPKVAVSASGEAYIMTQFSQNIMAGTTLITSQGGSDVLVAKYTSQGVLSWAQQFGGTGNESLGRGRVDAAGSLYVSGSFVGTVLLGSTTLLSAGDSDGCLVKYSAQGTVQWAQAGGGTGTDYWLNLSLDATGSPYVVGNFSGTAQFGPTALTSAGGYDIVVAAYTPQGLVRWAQRAGDTGNDFPYYIGVDASGDAYVVGDFIGRSAFGSFTLNAASAGIPTAFLARLGSSVLATQSARPLAMGCYPNPATDWVQLPELPTGSRVQLLDATGRTVRETTVTTAAQVSVRGLAPGFYTLRATTTQGRQLAGRLVVE